MCEICSDLTNKNTRTMSIFNFEQISHIAVVFSLLTLNKQTPTRNDPKISPKDISRWSEHS